MANQADIPPETNVKTCRPSCKFTIADVDASNIIRVKLRNKSSSRADGTGDDRGVEKPSPSKKARKTKPSFKNPIDHPDFKLLPESHQRWLIRIVAFGRSNSKKHDWEQWLTSSRPRRDRKLPAFFNNGDYEVQLEAKNSDCWCFVCGDGGTLFICDEPSCLKVFHSSCIHEDEARMNTRRKWVCPRHRCGCCPEDESPTLIFQCETCVYSRCRSHLDEGCVVAPDVAASDNFKSPRVICPSCHPPLLAKGFVFRPLEDLLGELDKHSRTSASRGSTEKKLERKLMAEKRQLAIENHLVSEPEPFAVKKPRHVEVACRPHKIPAGKRRMSSFGMDVSQSLESPSVGICWPDHEYSETRKRHRHSGKRNMRPGDSPAQEMPTSNSESSSENRSSYASLPTPDSGVPEFGMSELMRSESLRYDWNDVAFQSYSEEELRPPSEHSPVAESASKLNVLPMYHDYRHFLQPSRPDPTLKPAIKAFPGILRRKAPRDPYISALSKQASTTSPRSGRKRISKPSVQSCSIPSATMQITVPSTPFSSATSAVGSRAFSIIKKSQVLQLTPRTVSLFASQKASFPPALPPDLSAEQLPAERRGSYLPADRRGSYLPAEQVPTERGGSYLPADRRGSYLPAEQLPAERGGSYLPADQLLADRRGSYLPAEQVPAERRGSSASSSASPPPPCVPVQSSLRNVQVVRPSLSESGNSSAPSSRSSPTPTESSGPNSNSNSNSNGPALITSSNMRVAVMAKIRKKRDEALLATSASDAAFSEDGNPHSAGKKTAPVATAQLPISREPTEATAPPSAGLGAASPTPCSIPSSSPITNSNLNLNLAAEFADPDFDVDCFWASGNDEWAGDSSESAAGRLPAGALASGLESESESRGCPAPSRSGSGPDPAADASVAFAGAKIVPEEGGPVVEVATPEKEPSCASSSPLSLSLGSSCAEPSPESFSPSCSIRTGPCSPSDLAVEMPGPMDCFVTTV